MTDLTIAASITRALVDPANPTLADLDLNDGVKYKVVNLGPGTRRWVRDLATAPAVHGASQVSARMDLQTAPWAIRVLGTTKSQLDTRSKDLVAAFSQLRYQLTVTIDGTTETWKCLAADISPASQDGSAGSGQWDLAGLMARYRQVYTFQIPRQPVPVAGVM